MAGDLYEFQATYSRAPRTWRDYNYGMRQINRRRAAESLRIHRAVFMAQLVEADERSKWVALQEIQAR